LTSDNNADINFFFERIKKINENNTIPVIWKDGSGHLNSINIPILETLTTEKKQEILQLKLVEIIAENNKPIEMDMGFQKEYIYYGNSKLLKLLRYYPLSQLLVVLIIGFLGYIFLSYSRRAEQNRVWVGLAKETAHQLGTPISSLNGWINLMRDANEAEKDEILQEFEKDVKRLELITERFSKIGSAPVLKPKNIFEVMQLAVDYLRTRSSSQVKFSVTSIDEDALALVNVPLFDWVIENICKNAIDAMSGKGNINIQISTEFRRFKGN
jgi:signal transduction histidine kinase